MKRFQVVPGIGRKTAERVIVELRERIAGELAAEPARRRRPTPAPASLAREGLVGLGYDPAEAESDARRGGALRPARTPRPRT